MMSWSQTFVFGIGVSLGLSAGCQLIVPFETVAEGSAGTAGSGATGAGGGGGTTSTSSTGGGGTGASTGGASTGGSGGAPCTAACCSPADCPTPADPCIRPACSGGQCAEEPVPDGEDASTQIPGDCKRRICEGGLAKSVAQTDDPFDDGSECTVDACNGGVPTSMSAPSGTPCILFGQAGFCLQGQCVECIADTDCASGTPACNADLHICVPGPCADGAKNGKETSIDCGGPECAPCGFGKGCNDDADCESGDCTIGFCGFSSCSDGVKNGDETDVDCGGTSCLFANCGPLQHCESNGDCDGGLCTGPGGVCFPTCSDGVKNNAETDVDCGGGDCSPCVGGKACGVVDNNCYSGDCLPDGTCAKGPNGDPCNAGDQCESGSCADGVCCNTACSGACRDCALAGKVGTCSFIAAGTDPDGECASGETCNGQGACNP